MSRTIVGAVLLVACGAAAGSTQNTTLPAQVTVVGEVRTPGSSTAGRGLTLQAAIAQAGGFSADAAVIELRRSRAGVGTVTASTPASDYRATYLMRSELNVTNDPPLFGGDFVVVRRVLELHPPMPAGQFGAGAYRFDWATWGVAAPVVRTTREPQYTQAGMILKLQGAVDLEVVVKPDGTVGDARVMRGLDARLPELVAELKRLGGSHSDFVLQTVGNGPIGLDANALECVKTWTFEPGTILGRAVPVIQTVSVPFKLR